MSAFLQCGLSFLYPCRHAPSPVAIDPKLPWVGTTIFTVMSKLAADGGQINFLAGFPTWVDPRCSTPCIAPCSPAATSTRRWPARRSCGRASPTKVAALSTGIRYDVDSEVTVTAGATQASSRRIAAFVRPGDEGHRLRAENDSYVPAIEMRRRQGRVSRLMFPDYRLTGTVSSR